MSDMRNSGNRQQKFPGIELDHTSCLGDTIGAKQGAVASALPVLKDLLLLLTSKS